MSKFDIHEYQIMEEFCWSIADDKIRGALFDKIKGQVRELSDGLRMPSMGTKWKMNGIDFDGRNLKKLQLTGSKQTRSLIRKPRAGC